MSTRNSNRFLRRLTDVRANLDQWGVDALFIQDPANRRWLSGFTGSAGQLLVTWEKAVLSTDFRYWEQAASEAPAFAIFKHQRSDQDTFDFFASVPARKIGFAASNISVASMAELEKASAAEWIPLKRTLEQFRAVKDAGELASMRAAAAITDRAMAQVNSLASPGISERSLAWELEKCMRDDGADGTAFPIIVASGPHSAFPHHQPGNRLLRTGDIIVVDMGARVGNYNSDLTRSFYLGDLPDARFEHVYGLVMDAHDAALSAARPGMSSRQLDAVARDIIEAAGHGSDFGHGLGHGVGLEIHEAPSLSSRPAADDETLSAGMTVTIEPGVYLPGWAGIRIEDLVLLTADGSESLSSCPYSPHIPIS